jgi:transketolase
MGSIRAKFEALTGMFLTSKGNNIEAIIAGTEAKSRTGKGKPVCVLLHTEMGMVDFMMNTHAWHGKAPNDAQLENALAQNNNVGGELDY